MKEGDHVIVRQQRRLAAHAFGKVAHQMRHRSLQRGAVRAQPAGAHIVHPSTAALARAGTRVQVKLAQQNAAALNAVELHRRVPHRRSVAVDADLEQGFHNLEQAGQHLRRGKVIFDVLLAEGVARLFELFTDKGPIPGLRVGQGQVLGSEGAHLGHIFVGKRAGAGGQVAQKAGDFFARLRHLGGQRHGGEMRVAQQSGFFLTQGKDLLHQRAVVLRGVGGLVRGAGDIGAVDLLAQRAALRKLHDRQVAGHLQAQLVALCAVSLGRSAGRIEHVLRNPGEFFRAHQKRPLVGGIQHVFAELLAQLGLALLDRGKAFFGCARQLRAGQHEVAQRQGTGALLLRTEAGRINGFVLGVEFFVCPKAGPKLGDAGQGRVVGGAQFGRVCHPVQVADRAPGAAQALSGHIQHPRNPGPVGGKAAGGDGF